MSEYAIGVEEEYQLVDPASRDLRSSARAVLQGDWSGDIREELQDSTIEIGTRVCASSREVLAELSRLRVQADTAAGAEDLRIVAAGLHPFADWREHTLSAGQRYERIAATYGRIARDEHNFGMHIHVSVAGDRMRLIDRLRDYIPHLVALSCSSPFHEGTDTDFASYRLVLWRRWPGAGPPPRLGDDAAYRAFVDAQLRAGVLTDERSIYWLIRRHPVYPTIEFRMCDVCPRLADAAAIAGFARVLAGAAAAGRLPARLPASPAGDAVLADDCWRASRYGLGARLAGADGGFERAGTAVLRLLETLQPVAAELDEEIAFTDVAEIVRRGNAACRMREVFHACRELPGLVDWLAAETLIAAGMDRRQEQRSLPRCC